MEIVPQVFWATLIFGAFLIYIVLPDPEIVIQYPTLGGRSRLFRDDNGVCYRYKPHQTSCGPSR
jgi:hypothetical protein